MPNWLTRILWWKKRAPVYEPGMWTEPFFPRTVRSNRYPELATHMCAWCGTPWYYDQPACSNSECGSHGTD